MKMSLGRLSWQRHKKMPNQTQSKVSASSPEGPWGAWEQVLVGAGGRGEQLWGPQPVLARVWGADVGGSGAAGSCGHHGRPPSPFERKHGPAGNTLMAAAASARGRLPPAPSSSLRPGSGALPPAGAGLRSRRGGDAARGPQAQARGAGGGGWPMHGRVCFPVLLLTCSAHSFLICQGDF